MASKDQLVELDKPRLPQSQVHPQPGLPFPPQGIHPQPQGYPSQGFHPQPPPGQAYPSQGYPPPGVPMNQMGQMTYSPLGGSGEKDSFKRIITVSDQRDEYFGLEYEKSYPCYENCIQGLSCCCGTLRQFIVCLPFASPNQEIPQSYCGLKLRFGKYIETLGPGLQFITPFTEKLLLVDLQTQTLDLVKQNIITKDNITAAIDTAVNYKINNPRYAYFRLEDLNESVSNLCYSALRTVMGVYTLNELQEKKMEIAASLEKYLREHVKMWGISIEQIFIKDIILNADLQETLSSATKMLRAAESKVISAKADVESAKLMREAADTLSSEAAMQIRYYETIQHLAHTPAAKVIFIPFIQDQD